jgi:hypothetical protein
MKFKLFDTMYTNEMLLSILPFDTGYLLKDDTDEATDMPCEYSVMIAMILRGIDAAMHPHKEFVEPPSN